MIVICDKAQDVIIPAGLGDNPGVVYEKSGVESLNGQQGDLTLKTVNGNELLGEGNVAIDTGVESLNGQKGALTLKTVNGNELTGEGNIEIQAGVESVNGQTGALKLKTIDNKDVLGEGNMDILSDYSICMFMMYNLTLSEADKGVDLYKYGIGDDAANLDKYFSGFKTIQFLNFNIKGGASYKVPLTIFWDGDGNRQFRFVCEGYEYTYTSTDANYCDFTSKVKIGGESGLKYKQITNESRQEVYDDVKAHWDNASGYTGDYVYFYQNGVDQIIFDEVKFENNTAYFNSASVGYTSGQVHNPLVRLLCCIVPSEGNIQINENGRVLSDVNGMRYEANDAIVDSNSITFQENGYGDGYDVYNTTDTGTKDGLFDVRFKNGLDGFKGNAPASIFTDGTDVFMAFDVVDNHYVYKRDGNAWAFVSKTRIGGESGGESSKTYYFYNDPTRDPNAPNAHNVEVFRAFDKAVQEGGAFNNFYIVNGNETSGQTPYNPILQVTKMEAVDNGVWGGNKGYYVFAGQKSNVETEKLQVHKYCLTDIGGVIDFMVNAVDGGTWTSGVHSKIDDVLTAGQDIPFVFEYLEGCDETYFWADNMGGKQGLYNITFNGGYDGYKGNVVADVYGNATGVYMAFTVNNVRYTYKKNDTNSKWELAKSVQIGGVQSAEVSNIKVLTQSEYDALEPKDPNTMYCIKGQ